MDNKLACDRDVSGNCYERKTKSSMKEGSYMGLIVNCIGYQMISADKLDDHAI